jgi:hypothetical protein
VIDGEQISYVGINFILDIFEISISDLSKFCTKMATGVLFLNVQDMMTYVKLFHILLVQTVPSLLTKCFLKYQICYLPCCGINGLKQSNEESCFAVNIVHNLFILGLKA